MLRNLGQVPEQPIGPDCKSGGLMAYGGANPPLPTTFAEGESDPELGRNPTFRRISDEAKDLHALGVTQLISAN